MIKKYRVNLVTKYKNYFFCNLDFGTQLTGVERAALKRAKVFKRNFGIDVIFLTSRFNINLHKNVQSLKELGWMPKGNDVYNVYEYYRGFYSRQLEINKKDYLEKDLYNILDIASNPLHQKYISKVNEDFCKYVVWSDVAKSKLVFINNIFNKKTIKREKFDHDGHLFAIQELDEEGKVIIEDLIHLDGYVVLQRYFGEKNKLMKIVMFDRSGSIKDVFSNEEQLVDYWIKDIVDIQQAQCFIIDRNINWNIALKNYHKKTGHLSISLIHSSHMVEMADNIMTGRLNSNFKGILEDKYTIDHIVTLTPQQKSDIETRFPNKTNIVAIPHSIDILPKQIEFKDRNPLKIVAMCRLAPEKQVVDMVLMMNELIKEHRDVKLHIYGDGGEKNKIIEKITELNLQQSIILEGYTDDIGVAYHDAAFSLLTSRCEGFSLAILESLTYGVPAVSYDIPYGPASMIKNGVNGLLVEHGDYKKMAQELSNVLKDKIKMQDMSAQAYRSIEAYLEESVAQSWDALIG